MDSWWQTGSLLRLLLSANAMQVVGEKRADIVDTCCWLNLAYCTASTFSNGAGGGREAR